MTLLKPTTRGGGGGAASEGGGALDMSLSEDASSRPLPRLPRLIRRPRPEEASPSASYMTSLWSKLLAPTNFRLTGLGIPQHNRPKSRRKSEEEEEEEQVVEVEEEEEETKEELLPLPEELLPPPSIQQKSRSSVIVLRPREDLDKRSLDVHVSDDGPRSLDFERLKAQMEADFRQDGPAPPPPSPPPPPPPVLPLGSSSILLALRAYQAQFQGRLREVRLVEKVRRMRLGSSTVLYRGIPGSCPKS